jgi:hypothetical protein
MDSGLSGLLVVGEAKLVFRECWTPCITEVCLWCPYEVGGRWSTPASCSAAGRMEEGSKDGAWDGCVRYCICVALKPNPEVSCGLPRDMEGSRICEAFENGGRDGPRSECSGG